MTNHKCNAFVVFVLNYCMKKLLLLCVWVLPILLPAQTNFEGIITYKGTTTNDIKSFEIKMYFADSKMKIKVISPSLVEEANRTEIYNFKSGIRYTIFEDEKKYWIDSLDKLSFDDYRTDLKDTALAEYVQGYYCRGYIEIPDEGTTLPGGTLNIFWYPDSIKSIIPEKYRNKRRLETSDDGNMLFLKMQTIINLSTDEEDDLIKNKIDTFLIVANRIERMKINEQEFLPPANYTSSIDTYQDRNVIRDSVKIREIIITDISGEEKKTEPPPPPPPKVIKPSKSPIKKEKLTKPVKG